MASTSIGGPSGGLDLWLMPPQSHAIWQWLSVNLDPGSRVCSFLAEGHTGCSGGGRHKGPQHVPLAHAVAATARGHLNKESGLGQRLASPPRVLEGFRKTHVAPARVRETQHNTARCCACEELTKVPPWESWPVIWRTLTIAVNRCQGSRAKQMDGPSGIG